MAIVMTRSNGEKVSYLPGKGSCPTAQAVGYFARENCLSDDVIRIAKNQCRICPDFYTCEIAPRLIHIGVRIIVSFLLACILGSFITGDPSNFIQRGSRTRRNRREEIEVIHI